MTNRSRIYKSVRLIEANLQSNLTVDQVADQIGFSYYYFSHLFKAVTGISPSTYMNQRRIADSVIALMTTKKKIIDIALNYGYGSPEAYSRAFSKCFSQSPSDVRKQGLIHGDRMMAALEESQSLISGHKPYRSPDLITLDDLHLAGISFYYDLASGKNDLSDQWANLMDHVEDLPGLVDPPAFYQMQLWFPTQSPNTVYFYVAAKILKDSPVPIQMTAKTIPGQDYLRFYHKGLANRVGETYRFIYEEWLPGSDYKLPHLYNFEYYGPESLGPYNPSSITEIYIPIDL